jgi:predicted secreted protein
MATYNFSNKDPAETILVTFDFSNLLLDLTDYLIAASWSITTIQPPSTQKIVVDINPAIVIAGPVFLTPTTTSNYLTGGIDGNTYSVSVIATTRDNQILKLTANMKVEIQ